MPDYRSMYDNKYLGAWDFDGGKEPTLTISEVRGETLQNPGGKQKKPVILFEEVKDGRGLVLNKTNGRTIAALYGNDTAEWVGKKVTLYQTTTEVGGETKPCIRVRPERPGLRVAKGA